MIIPDEFQVLYDDNCPVRAFLKTDVEAADYLVKISQGKRDTVETAKDWGIVAKLFEFWTRRWPDEWMEFFESIKAIRETRANKQGMSKTREIKYVGALPSRFQRLIKAIFPLQQFDKEFVYKLTNNIQITKVGEKHDTWFVIPDAPSRRKTSKEMVDDAVKSLDSVKTNKYNKTKVKP